MPFNQNCPNSRRYDAAAEAATAAAYLDAASWTVAVDGAVDKPGSYNLASDILSVVAVEERVYRHRCVEAWSVAVPWAGFPLAALMDLVGAGFIRSIQSTRATRTHTRAYRYTHTHTHTRARARAHTHTRTRAYRYTHTHTFISRLHSPGSTASLSTNA